MSLTMSKWKQRSQDIISFYLFNITLMLYAKKSFKDKAKGKTSLNLK